jgi:hypothetical protein
VIVRSLTSQYQEAKNELQALSSSPQPGSQKLESRLTLLLHEKEAVRDLLVVVFYFCFMLCVLGGVIQL